MYRREVVDVFKFKLFKSCNFNILFIYSLKISYMYTMYLDHTHFLLPSSNCSQIPTHEVLSPTIAMYMLLSPISVISYLCVV